VGSIFYHLLPGLLFDLILWLQGKKPILIKSYGKIHEALRLLYPFSGKTYEMDMNNTNHMWESMSPEDKSIFPFDMSSLDWEEYCTCIMSGMRGFLFKESWDTLDQAKRKHFWCVVLMKI